EGDGHRPRSRRPDRRHDRPRGAPAGDDEAARRLELVPAELARLAPAARARYADPARGARSRSRLSPPYLRRCDRSGPRAGPDLRVPPEPPAARPELPRARPKTERPGRAPRTS